MLGSKSLLFLVLASLALYVTSSQIQSVKTQILESTCKPGSSNPNCRQSENYMHTPSCPPGHYCPEGSKYAVACPIGTFSWVSGAVSSDACKYCPANTYASQPGSTACSPCGPYSSSKSGSAECSCEATNRQFHISDGSCRCKVGYELTHFAAAAEARVKMGDQSAFSSGLRYMKTAISSYTSDSVTEDIADDAAYELVTSLTEAELARFDCKPIDFGRCSNGEVRSALGECVSRTGAHCAVECGTAANIDEVASAADHGHYFDLTSGLCQCKASETPVCDVACQAALPALALTVADNTDVIQVAFPASGALPARVFTVPAASLAIEGNMACSHVTAHSVRDLRAPVCPLHIAATAGNGVAAVYGLPAALRAALVAADADSQAYVDALPTAETGAPTVAPALFCLHQGESVLFNTSPRTLSFPHYVTRSGLNSDPVFDYAPFANTRQHAMNAAASSASIPDTALFAHTFAMAGTYVFQDSAASPSALSVIRVLPAGQRCPPSLITTLNVASTDAAPASASLRAQSMSVGPLAVSSLSSLGVANVHVAAVVAAPNWSLVGILLAIFIGIFLICTFIVVYMQKSRWAELGQNKPVYRKQAADDSLDIWTFSTKGTVTNVESRSSGVQKLEMDKEDLLIEALARIQGRQKGVMEGVAAKLKLKYMHTPHDPLLSADEKRVMNELASNTDFDDVDFQSLYKTIEDTNSRMRSYFARQGEALHIFYNKTETDIEHLKSLLSVKMQVQMQRTGEGFAEAVDRLVSGELLARQAFHELYTRRESNIKMLLEEVRSRIVSITIDCNIFPVMQLLKEVHEVIRQSEQRLLQERVRRKTFASHVEIVGKDIIEILLKQDKLEVDAQDDYWHALLYFDGQVQEVRKTMHARESAHLIEMEALTNEEDRRVEQMQYHRAMVELVRVIQIELMSLEERLSSGIMQELVDRNDESYDIWVFIQSTLLQKRLNSLRSPTEGRIFRGVNPDLAKVLTGVMGMMRSGIKVNPKTGCYVPKAPFDPADPFQTITDPGDVYREWYEQQLASAVDQIRLEADDMRREQEEAELAHLRAEEDARLEYERRLQEEIEREREAMRNAQIDMTTDHVLQDIVAEDASDEVQAVAEDLQKDQRELLAGLMRKRDDIESMEDISDEEKQKLLQVWDDKIEMMQEMLKDEALGLISYLQSQKQEEAAPEPEEDDKDSAPSLRELELVNELHQVKAQLDALTATVNVIAEEDEDEINAAEKLLLKKEKEMASFEKANSEKLRELDDLIRQRKQARLLGEMGDLADDDLEGLELDEEYRALQLARIAHAEELENAKGRVMRKRQDVQNRQEAKRQAIEEAERREAALKRELMEDQEEDDEDDDDESMLAERKRRFEETQRKRREAELARLEEDQRRAIAAASDAGEAKRIVKEFEMNKLNLLKKLNQEEQGQRSKLEDALRRRNEARNRKLMMENETTEERAERKKRALTALLDREANHPGEDDSEMTEEQQESVRAAQEIIFENDGLDESELVKLSEAERAVYLAQKQKYEADKDARIAKRKDARRKRIEGEQRREADREKAREIERLQRIHHDMELDMMEESLLQELEDETRNVIDEAVGLAGIEVFNMFAAHARKQQVELKIERVKQSMEDTKEADEERTMEEAQKLLSQAAKEREDLEQQRESEQNRQEKILRDRLAARRNQNASKMKEDRERRKKAEALTLENAQRQAELNAQLQMIQGLVSMINPESQPAEARRIIEAQLFEGHNKEKVSLLATQSAERKMLWKEKMLENGDISPEEIQGIVSSTYDDQHNEQLRAIDEKQLEDVKSLYAKLFPNTDFSGPEWHVDREKHMLQELAQKKNQMLEDERRRKEEEYERKRKDLEEKERKLEEENQRKLQELQSKSAADDAEYQQLLASHDEKLIKNHKLLLARKQQLLDADLQSANQQDHELRQRLAVQQREEMARYEAALRDEYQRQKQAMVKRLQERRTLQKQRKVDDDRKRRDEERKRKQMEERINARAELQNKLAEAEEKQQSAPAANAPAPAMAGISAATATQAAAPAAGAVISATVGRRRGVNRAPSAAVKPASASLSLTASSALAEEMQQKARQVELQAKKEEEERKTREEVNEKLEAIRSMLVTLDEQKRAGHRDVWVDDKEVLIKPLRAVQLDSTLGASDSAVRLAPEPKPIASMLPREFVLYRFGVSLLRLFSEQGYFTMPMSRRRAGGDAANIPSLLIASGLPPSPYTNTSFPNSYWYECSENRLWIRQERLSDPGEFVLVVLHALAHISSSKDGESFHDHDATFTQTFLGYMRVVCSELYFSRSLRALSAVGETVPGHSGRGASEMPGDDDATDGTTASIDDVDLFDSETNTSLLPSTHAPRIPKLQQFRVESVDLTSAGAADTVDDLIEMHVSAVDPQNHISSTGADSRRNTKTYGAVLSSAHGMTHYGTAQLMQRLGQYEAFAASTKLREFLGAVERKQAGFDRTRLQLSGQTYASQGNAVARANAREVEDKLSREVEEETADVGAMEDVCDELNRQLISVVEQGYECSAKLQMLEQKQVGAGVSLRVRAQLAGEAEAERVLMTRLEREKGVLLQRLRHLEQKDIVDRKQQTDQAMSIQGLAEVVADEKKKLEEANAGTGELDLVL